MIGTSRGANFQMRFACTPQARLRGMLGRADREGVLLLAPCRDVHTVGMDTAIDVAFLGRDGRVSESYRNLKPGRRVRSKQACAVVERVALPGEPWLVRGDSLLVDFRKGAVFEDGSDGEEKAVADGAAAMRAGKGKHARGER